MEFTFPDNSIKDFLYDRSRYRCTIADKEYGTGNFFAEQVGMKRTQLYCFLRSKKILDVEIYMGTDGKWNVPSRILMEKFPGYAYACREKTRMAPFYSPLFSLNLIDMIQKKFFVGPFDIYNPDFIDFNKNYHPKDYEALRQRWFYFYQKGISLYERYMRSSRWQDRSAELKKRNNFTCQLCGAHSHTPPAPSVMKPLEFMMGYLVELHTHHLTYERIYDEYDYDLIVVCSDCHKKLHEKYDGTEYDPKNLKNSNYKLLTLRKRLIEGDIK